MFGIKRRRTLIRVLSYTISAFCLAIIVGISGYVMAYKYRMNIEYTYQRALQNFLNTSTTSISLCKKRNTPARVPNFLTLAVKFG